MTQIAAFTFLMAAITLSTPLVLAALGGYLSERGGVVNIALEGNMVVATVFGALASVASGNPIVGLAAAIGAACVLSLVHFALTQVFRVEQVISGMACNLLALGVANITDRLSSISGGHKVVGLPVQAFVVAALVIPFVLDLASNHTRFGVRLLASGGDPDKARQMGVEPLKVRLAALLGTGALCGLAGAFMISNVGIYTEGMTANRGYIALAALIVGGWKPVRALVACLVFGFFEALQVQMQGVPLLGMQLPREVWLSLPYLATVAALASFMMKGRAPAGLGKV